MKFGIRFTQSMAGTLYFLDAPLDEREVRIAMTVAVEGLRQAAFVRQGTIEGRVGIERFATDNPMNGVISLRFIDDGRVRYDFNFEADDGAKYVLRGEQRFDLMDPIGSITTLPASLYDVEGREIARSQVRFDWKRDWKPLLQSIRPTATFA